ncbi:MAG: hypothetical protein ACODAA_05880 [Gemmatimonadota bacterium]
MNTTIARVLLVPFLIGTIGCQRGGEGSAESSSGETPPFVAAGESAPVASSSPATSPDDWRLAFVDVETTGLLPGWHEMIDLGVVMTDLDGRPLDSLFVRIQPEHPERTSEGARAVNAFDAARWRELGALSPAAAVDNLRRFHRSVAGEGPVLLVAFNSQFDTAFLDHLFRSDGGSWRELYHYLVLDIPSMAWALGLREVVGGDLPERLGVEDEPHVAEDHTGITGARLNARLYRALLAPGRERPGADARRPGADSGPNTGRRPRGD